MSIRSRPLAVLVGAVSVLALMSAPPAAATTGWVCNPRSFAAGCYTSNYDQFVIADELRDGRNARVSIAWIEDGN